MPSVLIRTKNHKPTNNCATKENNHSKISSVYNKCTNKICCESNKNSDSRQFSNNKIENRNNQNNRNNRSKRNKHANNKSKEKPNEKSEKLITFLYTNIRSLKNKLTELKALVNIENPDIIGLTETWLKCDTNEFESEFNLEGYTILKNDRKIKKGGGVLLYVKDNLKPTRLSVRVNSDKVESIWAQIRGENNKYLNVGVVYRPPDQKPVDDDKMCDEIKRIVTRNQSAVVMGDFNLPDINWENLDVHSYYNNRNQDDQVRRLTPSEKLLETIQDNFLVQNVHEPTRGGNILDLVIATEENLVQNVQVGEHIATCDHNLIRGEINISKELDVNDQQIYNYKRGNYNKISQKLSRIDWNILFRDKNPSDMYNIFTNKLMELVDRFVPK